MKVKTITTTYKHCGIIKATIVDTEWGMEIEEIHKKDCQKVKSLMD